MNSLNYMIFSSCLQVSSYLALLVFIFFPIHVFSCAQYFYVSCLHSAQYLVWPCLWKLLVWEICITFSKHLWSYSKTFATQLINVLFMGFDIFSLCLYLHILSNTSLFCVVSFSQDALPCTLWDEITERSRNDISISSRHASKNIVGQTVFILHEQMTPWVLMKSSLNQNLFFIYMENICLTLSGKTCTTRTIQVLNGTSRKS